jgi:hypothetical protein
MFTNKPIIVVILGGRFILSEEIEMCDWCIQFIAEAINTY